jgi:hypothetical protein
MGRNAAQADLGRRIELHGKPAVSLVLTRVRCYPSAESSGAFEIEKHVFYTCIS